MDISSKIHFFNPNGWFSTLTDGFTIGKEEIGERKYRKREKRIQCEDCAFIEQKKKKSQKNVIKNEKKFGIKINERLQI